MKDINYSICSIIHYIKLESNYHISKTMKSIGISYPQALIILTIDKHKEISISDLSNETFTSLPNCSLLCQRLEKQDYIKRIKNEHDQRSYKLSLTSKSKKIIKNIKASIGSFNESLEALLTDEEREIVEEGLDILYNKLKELRGQYETRD